MTLVQDNLWIKSKKIARQHGKDGDWNYVVTLYNMLGGEHVIVNLLDVPGKQRYRVLAVTDNGQALTLNGDQVVLLDGVDAFRMKKEFTSASEGTFKEVPVKDFTILGKPYYTYYEH